MAILLSTQRLVRIVVLGESVRQWRCVKIISEGPSGVERAVLFLALAIGEPMVAAESERNASRTGRPPIAHLRRILVLALSRSHPSRRRKMATTQGVRAASVRA